MLDERESIMPCFHPVAFDEDGSARVIVNETLYKSNQICNFLVRPGEKSVTIDVLHLDIENDPLCQRDFVAISAIEDEDEDIKLFDFQTVPNKLLLRKMCGACQLEPFVIKEDRPIMISFRSNKSFNFRNACIFLSHQFLFCSKKLKKNN